MYDLTYGVGEEKEIFGISQVSVLKDVLQLAIEKSNEKKKQLTEEYGRVSEYFI